jgi:Lrp/AsnC family transcriptional regulator, regulator for asnA, asnC and gidA
MSGGDHLAELDPVERRIVALLQKDGRTPIQQLAATVGASEVTVRKKLRRLLKDRVVQVVAAVDPFQIGYECPVFIGLKLDRARIDEIADRICAHPSVRYVGATAGRFDLIVEVVAASNRDLAEFLLTDLAAVDGIVETQTSLILKVYKQSWDWGLREPEEPAAGADGQLAHATAHGRQRSDPR